MDVSTFSIAEAILNGTLTLEVCEGRFGKYWSINDERGMISIELTIGEAHRRIADVKAKLRKMGRI